MTKPSPATEFLPSPVSNTSSPRRVAEPSLARVARAQASTSPDATLPRRVTRQPKYFEAVVVSNSSDSEPTPDSMANATRCPSWSPWAASQFVFDYLFTLITSTMTSECFIRQYHEQYIDVLFKLEKIISALGMMPDASPPPSFFQSLYYLKRLFPRGLLALEDFTGHVGTTLLLQVFSMGIAVANQAICEQRNYNLEWEYMCGIPDFHVDALEIAAIVALDGDLFDLSQDRALFLDWLAHLGLFTESHRSRAAHPYLRTLADLIAYTRAHAFFLPRQDRRRHIQPIHFQSLENLASVLCGGTGVAPTLSRLDYLPPPIKPIKTGRTKPTAESVLAAVAEECESCLLYPLSVRTSWSNLA